MLTRLCIEIENFNLNKTWSVRWFLIAQIHNNIFRVLWSWNREWMAKMSFAHYFFGWLCCVSISQNREMQLVVVALHFSGDVIKSNANWQARCLELGFNVRFFFLNKKKTWQPIKKTDVIDMLNELWKWEFEFWWADFNLLDSLLSNMTLGNRLTVCWGQAILRREQTLLISVGTWNW